MTELERAVDRVLVDSMAPGLKAALDAALAKGATAAELLRRVRRAAGGKRTTTVLAVEAYLGRPQAG